MSATARKLRASFEKLDPEDRRAVAVEILRLVGDDGLEEELAASAAALFRGFEGEAAHHNKGLGPGQTHLTIRDATVRERLGFHPHS